MIAAEAAEFCSDLAVFRFFGKTFVPELQLFSHRFLDRTDCYSCTSTRRCFHVLSGDYFAAEGPSIAAFMRYLSHAEAAFRTAAEKW
jgi:hypothetical protein